MDKVAREQVVVQQFVGRHRIDEDVGERSGREADVARPREQREQAPDCRVDRRGLLRVLARVDRRVVRLVVDQQERQVDLLLAVDIVGAQPARQTTQHALVLLRHHEHRLADGIQRDLERRGRGLAEILLLRGEHDTRPAAVKMADADQRAVLQLAPRKEVAAVETNEGGVEALLRLAPDVFQRPAEQDDHAVARICGLAQESRVGGGLAGLDVSHD